MGVAAKIKKVLSSRSFSKFIAPMIQALSKISSLNARGERPLQMGFEDQIKILIYYHLQEHKSGRELLQDLEQNAFAEQNIAPKKGINRSSFFEAMGTRGLEQTMELFQVLLEVTSKILPIQCKDFGELHLIDGSLIDAVLSMDGLTIEQTQRKPRRILRSTLIEVFLTKSLYRW